jgi:hypothetical protein
LKGLAKYFVVLVAREFDFAGWVLVEEEGVFA